MIKVPSTETIYDTHKELKELRDSISLLKSEQESNLRSRNEVLYEIDSLREQKNLLEKELQNIGSNVVETTIISKDIFNESLKLIHGSNDIFYSYKNELDKLTDKLTEIRKIVLTVDKYKEEQLNILATERINIEKSKSDLSVYKNRLEKIINENNLDIKII